MYPNPGFVIVNDCTPSPDRFAVAVAVVPIPTPISRGAAIDTVGATAYPLPDEIRYK